VYVPFCVVVDDSVDVEVLINCTFISIVVLVEDTIDDSEVVDEEVSDPLADPEAVLLAVADADDDGMLVIL
jgi:hypothetical protein